MTNPNDNMNDAMMELNDNMDDAMMDLWGYKLLYPYG